MATFSGSFTTVDNMFMSKLRGRELMVVLFGKKYIGFVASCVAKRPIPSEALSSFITFNPDQFEDFEELEGRRIVSAFDMFSLIKNGYIHNEYSIETMSRVIKHYMDKHGRTAFWKYESFDAIKAKKVKLTATTPKGKLPLDINIKGMFDAVPIACAFGRHLDDFLTDSKTTLSVMRLEKALREQGRLVSLVEAIPKDGLSLQEAMISDNIHVYFHPLLGELFGNWLDKDFGAWFSRKLSDIEAKFPQEIAPAVFNDADSCIKSALTGISVAESYANNKDGFIEPTIKNKYKPSNKPHKVEVVYSTVVKQQVEQPDVDPVVATFSPVEAAAYREIVKSFNAKFSSFELTKTRIDELLKTNEEMSTCLVDIYHEIKSVIVDVNSKIAELSSWYSSLHLDVKNGQVLPPNYRPNFKPIRLVPITTKRLDGVYAKLTTRFPSKKATDGVKIHSLEESDVIGELENANVESFDFEPIVLKAKSSRYEDDSGEPTKTCYSPTRSHQEYDDEVDDLPKPKRRKEYDDEDVNDLPKPKSRREYDDEDLPKPKRRKEYDDEDLPKPKSRREYDDVDYQSQKHRSRHEDVASKKRTRVCIEDDEYDRRSRRTSKHDDEPVSPQLAAKAKQVLEKIIKRGESLGR